VDGGDDATTVADVVVAGATLVATVDDNRREVRGGWVAIGNGLIEAVGTGPEPPARVRIDASGCLVTPGLVNSHIHLTGEPLARTSSTILLLWDRPGEQSNVRRYEVLCDNSVVGKSEKLSFTLTQLAAGQSYRVAVRGLDAAGRVASESENRQVSTLAAGSVSVSSQPSGARSSQACSNSPKPGMDLAAIVRSGPAETRLTRMPFGPRYRARYRLADSRPALATPIQS